MTGLLTVAAIRGPAIGWGRSLAVGVLVATLALASAEEVQARDYFVRADGNDSNSGTVNSASGAFRTVKKCATLARAGDRCLIQSGRYRESGIETVNGGTTTNNVMSSCSCTKGSTAISCSSAVSGLSVGDFVQCDQGFGFFWTEVASVSGSTITLVEGYRGPSATDNTLDSAKMVQFIGANGTTPAPREDVVVTSLSVQPSDVRWTDEGGCVYSYPLAGTTNPSWAAPMGFREVVPLSSWDLYAGNKNGLDAYDATTIDACPCARATLAEAVRDVPGSWAKDASKVYLQTRGCANPGTIPLEAGTGDNPTFAVRDPLVIVRNLTFETHGADGLHNTERWAYMVNTTNDVLTRDARCHGGRCGLMANGVRDIRFENLKALHTLKVGSSNSLNNSGLLFYNVEVRGGYANTITVDSMSGASAADPVTFDRFYVHRGWTAKRSSLCGQNDQWDCSVQPGRYFASEVNRAAHGTYIGSNTADRTVSNLLFQNCIYEITYDGLGVFTSAGDNVTVRNCTFAGGEYIGAGTGASQGGGLKIYNSLWHCSSGLCARQLYYYGGPWPTGAVVADYNAFIFQSNAGENALTARTHWTNFSNADDWNLDQVKANRGQEANSVVVCASGCSSSQGIRTYNDGSNARLTDTTVDVNATNYTPLAGSRVIDAGLNAQCPEHDFYGNPRRDGRCDIGAVEFQGGTVDTTPPLSVAGFAALGQSGTVVLSWLHSSSNDSKGTLVRVRTDRYPNAPTDGSEVCRKDGVPGSSDSCTLSAAATGTLYYFAAFSYDLANNYGAAATATGTPSTAEPPPPPTGVQRGDTRP